MIALLFLYRQQVIILETNLFLDHITRTTYVDAVYCYNLVAWSVGLLH